MRFNITLKYVLFLVALTFLAPGCAAKKKSPEVELYQLDSILVLPTDNISGTENDLNSPAQSLNEGALALSEIIADYLDGIAGIQFISPEQQDTLLTEYNQDRTTQALSIGKELHVDAVLTSRVNRYRQRTGQDYSVDTPASISFEYRLMLAETGQTLCSGVFDETQQSLTDNILSFKKAFKRGGKWITINDLAKEGVESEFSNCRFLKR
jgi:ABC-type uncharacterized transport system auxiliary subunit